MTTPLGTTRPLVPPTPLWWQSGIIYQIYPRSYQDSNGDGIGDLPGIIDRLDYLHWLGIDAVWISPFYPSPMADFGYDVADHCDVHPMFGTLADFDRLVHEAHARGMKVLVDFVPNHVSDQHPWFVDARRSRESPYRDWFIWKDPAPDGGPPNNWRAVFGGSAWELDAATGQYYLHQFLPEQPDLDWRNPQVVAAMLDVLRFWMRRGADGFRIDAIHHLIEHASFADEPPNPAWRPELGSWFALSHELTLDQPETVDAVIAMRRVLDEFPETMMVTEAYLPIPRMMAYYGTDGSGAHLPFNFQLIELAWEPALVRAAIANYEAALPSGAWPNWVLGNHDRQRVASRVGAAQARVAAMLLLTLRGTPTIYQGDELGMADVPIPPDRVQDPWEHNMPGLGYGRDPVRTPMQWDASPNAGFTTGRPWLPIAANAGVANVAVEREDPRSMLTLHQRLIALRRAEPALAIGAWRAVESEGDVVVYVREHDGSRFLIALNFGSSPASIPLGGLTGRVVLSTQLDREEGLSGSSLSLRADEGVVIEVR